jgi:hypothetical protein
MKSTISKWLSTFLMWIWFYSRANNAGFPRQSKSSNLIKNEMQKHCFEHFTDEYKKVAIRMSIFYLGISANDNNKWSFLIELPMFTTLLIPELSRVSSSSQWQFVRRMWAEMEVHHEGKLDWRERRDVLSWKFRVLLLVLTRAWVSQRSCRVPS